MTTGSELLVLVIGMDYFFLTKEGIERRDELADELGNDSEAGSPKPVPAANWSNA